MNWYLWLNLGLSGLFLATINHETINFEFWSLWVIYRDIKTLDLIETKKGLMPSISGFFVHAFGACSNLTHKPHRPPQLLRLHTLV